MYIGRSPHALERSAPADVVRRHWSGHGRGWEALGVRGRRLAVTLPVVSPHSEQLGSAAAGADLPDPDHPADDVDDATIEALGALSEALEHVERARGHLYSFHQVSGRADITLQSAVEKLRGAGHGEVADRLERELVGRNVLEGRWTFQVVEEYDDGYWSVFRGLEEDARRRLVGGRRHLLESRMKQRERSAGQRGHEATPEASPHG